MAEVPSTRKVQITVPVADSSVVEWLDLQYSASESVRRLIREAIAREGFVDVANRPVRPPAHPVHVAETFPDDEAPAATASAPSRTTIREAAAPKAAAPAEPAPQEPDDATAPSAPKASRSRSSDAAASATIDDLLGL